MERTKHLFQPSSEIQSALGRVAIMADTAHAFGAKWHGRMIGSVADFSSFSFHAVKNLTTAEGGALTWRTEHFLGLTCDPVLGLVQIPCIERNAIAANRAIIAAEMALLSDGTHFVSFDAVVQTMLQTGRDMPSLYRETSSGGLSVFSLRKN